MPSSMLDDSYIYKTDIGSVEEVEMIKVRFTNVLRGADQNFVIVDRIFQVSDTNSSQIIINSSDRVTLTSDSPLRLGEGYELAVVATDINGNMAYVRLFRNGDLIDSRVIVPPQKINDTYIYSTHMGSANDVEKIRIHFLNAFRGADLNLATVDRIWQTSEINSSQIVLNSSDRSVLAVGEDLKMEEGYELAIKSIDIDGNKIYPTFRTSTS
jgi:hypothetical protein